MKNALKDVYFLEKDAADFGFKWPNYKMIIDQTISECHEIQSAIENQEGDQRIQEEVGDLLQAAVMLCYYLGFDAQETLTKANNKFADRMDRVKEAAKAAGYDTLKGQPHKVLMQLWNSCK